MPEGKRGLFSSAWPQSRKPRNVPKKPFSYTCMFFMRIKAPIKGADASAIFTLKGYRIFENALWYIRSATAIEFFMRLFLLIFEWNMGGCAAMNCSNHSKNKLRLFKFPADETRRRKWIINCRRDGWVPGPRAELCEFV